MSEEVSDKIKWLEDSLADHIKTFKKKKSKNKRRAFISNILIASLGLVTTALLSINIMFSNHNLKIVSIILAVIITIISSINIFFNFNSLWTRYVMTINSLYEIRDDLSYFLVGKLPNDIALTDLNKFKNRINKVLNETNVSWKNLNNK